MTHRHDEWATGRPMVDHAPPEGVRTLRAGVRCRITGHGHEVLAHETLRGLTRAIEHWRCPLCGGRSW